MAHSLWGTIGLLVGGFTSGSSATCQSQRSLLPGHPICIGKDILNVRPGHPVPFLHLAARPISHFQWPTHCGGLIGLAGRCFYLWLVRNMSKPTQLVAGPSHLYRKIVAAMSGRVIMFCSRSAADYLHLRGPATATAGSVVVFQAVLLPLPHFQNKSANSAFCRAILYIWKKSF